MVNQAFCAWQIGQPERSGQYRPCTLQLVASYPCPAPPALHIQADTKKGHFLDTVDVLNLATGESSTSPTLPVTGGEGCVAFDSDSGYVYLITGEGDSDGAVHRIQGE